MNSGESAVSRMDDQSKVECYACNWLLLNSRKHLHKLSRVSSPFITALCIHFVITLVLERPVLTAEAVGHEEYAGREENQGYSEDEEGGEHSGRRLRSCKLTHSIVLVNWNGFPPIFQKVQYFHSRHKNTTSPLLRISLNGILKLNEVWPLEGAMYISLWENYRGHPDNVLSFM